MLDASGVTLFSRLLREVRQLSKGAAVIASGAAHVDRGVGLADAPLSIGDEAGDRVQRRGRPGRSSPVLARDPGIIIESALRRNGRGRLDRIVERRALTVPGPAGRSVPVTFTVTGTDTTFANEFGVFPVDDATGRIGKLRPGDPRYAAAALSEAGQRVIFAQRPTPGETVTVSLPGSSFLGLYLVQNSTTAKFRVANPGDRPGRRPLTFFQFASANPDRFDHVRQDGINNYAFEDLRAGGDRDFNDLVLHVEFAQPGASPSTPPTPTPTPAPAPPAQPNPTVPVAAPPIGGGPVDRQAPTVRLTAPTEGLLTRTNPAVSGQARADAAGLATVEARVDGGSPFAVLFDEGGRFAFGTSLPLDGSADGTHTISARATDKAGNVSDPVSTSFTLDATPPPVGMRLDPAFDTGGGHTLSATVSLAGTTEPGTPVVLEQTGARATSDPASGIFTFSGVSLAVGANTFVVRATDWAGNVGSAGLTVTLDVASAGGTTLREGSRFATSYQQSITVPDAPSKLEFRFDGLDFGTDSHFIKDAFEVSLTDADGNPLVLPILGTRDAALNITEGQAPVLSPNVRLDGGVVDIDLSHIPAGTVAVLHARLLNDDADTRTSVHINDPVIIPAAMDTPAAAMPAVALAGAASTPEVASLADVTSSMTADYGETSLDAKAGVLHVGLSVTNSGTYAVGAPLLAVIRNLSDPSIRVRGGDGVAPDGSPYFLLAAASADGTLAPGQATSRRTLDFSDPGGIQFTYDLEVLGQLNRPPVFTSQPSTEAVPGMPYSDQATASDADGDRLNFTLLAGPDGMSVDAASGRVAWDPQQGDIGNQAILLQVDDGHGGRAQQSYTLGVAAAPPDRPPLFTSTPLVLARVDTPYAYQATATDPDGDPLSYVLGMPPVSVTVANPSFETPTLPDAGLHQGEIPGWTISGTGNAGIFHPLAFEFSDGVPDGKNVAFSDGDTISQVLTERLTAGTRYVLQVDVGRRNGFRPPPFSVELWAGGFLAGTSTPAPAEGTSSTVTVDYNAPSDGPFLGQPLEIRLISSGVEACFDDVRLTEAELGGISGMALDPASGLLTWTSSSAQLGPQPVALQAQDGRGGVALQTFTVNVLQDAADHAPSIVSQPVTRAEGSLPSPDAQRQTIDFEGLPAAENLRGGPIVPGEDRVSDEFLETDGVTLRSDSGVPSVAVVLLGLGHAPSGSLGIGGINAAGQLDYKTPIVAEFFLPDDPATPAVTDFVSVTGDRFGDFTIMGLEAYDARGHLLETTSAFDTGDVTLSIAASGIHSIRMLGNTTSAFDDLTFGPLYVPSSYRYDVDAIDPDGDALSYSLVAPPTGMDIDAASGVITWIAPPVPASYPITVRVEDGRGGIDTQSFDIVVDQAGTGQIRGVAFDDLDGNGTRDPQEPALAGRSIYLDPNHDGIHDPAEPAATTGADGGYSFINVTPGVYTVAIEGQPGSRQTTPVAGTYVVTVHPGETVGGLDFGAATITSGARLPAIVSTAPTVAAVGRPYRYAVSVSDPDGVALQFDLSTAPAGMTVDAGTGVVAWTPAASQVGPQDAILRLRDTRGDVVLQAFHVVVGIDTAPVITSTPIGQAVTLRPYRYRVEAQDAEGDPLTFSLLEAPIGMAIDGANGAITWVGPAIGLGLPVTFSVTVQVGDGRGGQDTQTFAVKVVADTPDQAPSIGSPPRTSVALGQIYLYAVLATDPDGDPLAYDLPTAPPGMSIDADGLIRRTPSASQFGPNDVTVRVRDGRGGEATQVFTVDVTSRPRLASPRITSAPPLVATLGREYAYDATGTDPDGSPLVWSFDAAPAGMSIDPTRGRVRWSPTAEELGPQRVVIRLTSGEGLSTTQAFSIQVRAFDLPPQITSIPLTFVGFGQTYTYAVAASDPDGDPITEHLTAFATGMTFDAATGLLRWTPTADQIGFQAIAIEIDDGLGGTAAQKWIVRVLSDPVNHPPAITSMPPLTPGAEYRYAVTATDPDGSPLKFSQLTAPAGMTIDPDSGLIQWSPTPDQIGPNRVTVVATDPQGAIAVQTFEIVVVANHAPAITSIPRSTAPVGLPYRYDVIAGDADGDSLAYALTTAPSGMTIDALGRISWSPQAGDIGSRPVVVTVSDGRGGNADQPFTILVGADAVAPRVDLLLGANPADLGSQVVAVVKASDDVGVTSLGLTLDGTPVALDAMGRATLPAGTAGTFTLVATASDAAGNAVTTAATLRVIDPSQPGAPTVALTSPAEGASLTAPTPVEGTITGAPLASYSLDLENLDGSLALHLGGGTSVPADGVLGTIDPTGLNNNRYFLRLTATSAAGKSSTDAREVDLTGHLKLGDFKLAFNDLTLPLDGVPVSLTRIYDTLQANTDEDFGFGWRLDYADTDLRSSVPTTGHEQDGIFNPYRDGARVFVTVPGGRRESFRFDPQPAPGLLGGFLGILRPAFDADPGITDTLSVESADLRREGDGTYTDFSGSLPYNPASSAFGGDIRLTTKDGIVYTIDGVTGDLVSSADRNGHTLHYTAAGILSDSGKMIAFTRDPRGRIAAVTDPAGKSLHYAYDAAGDLASATDRDGNTMTFTYRTDRAHYLDEVHDPFGRTGAKTTYDDQGRMSTVVDPSGKGTAITYDPDQFLDTVNDALGNPTTYVYDEHGNILTQVNPLGAKTTQTFDANDNLLARTDALGRKTAYSYDAAGNLLSKTDPLGNVTRYTYNALNEVLTNTDPLGNTTTNTYDDRGNLTATTDAAGDTTRYTYDGRGNLLTTTDALGRVTVDAYDAAGNQTGESDALGDLTTYGYDVMNNLTSESTTQTTPTGSRTLTTTLSYDDSLRFVGTTDPLGFTTTVTYDADGRQVASTDPLGHGTASRYDDEGRLDATIYADGSQVTSQFDADGNTFATTDQGGRVTRYVYDADHRQVATIEPDDTPDDPADNPRTQTIYDAADEVVATIDELGRETTYAYDEAGDRIRTTDAAGDVTSTTYDTDHRPTSVTDPLGHTTRMTYDPLGRVVAVRYADGSTATTAYDALGNVSSRTDPLGRTTRYEYDALRRQTAVIDALGDRTAYAYDELGDVVAQTDARGNVTRYEYDGDGRITATILPLGERSTIGYDAAGNVVTRTDAQGRTTTADYDAVNRLVAEHLADGTSVLLTYTPTGQRASVIDVRGTTSYVYDARDRLLSVTNPDGTRVAYAYDASGNRLSVATPAGTTAYAYDAVHRLSTVVDPAGGVTRYTHDAAGNPVKTTLPDGSSQVDSYDALNRLTAVVTEAPDGSVIASDRYTLGPTGRRDADAQDGGRAVVYLYDALDRLLAEVVTDPVNGDRTTTYTYDASGNRLTAVDSLGGATSYTYDEDDRLATSTTGGVVTTYTYDAAGNTLSRAAGPTDRVDYRWDVQGRLVGATLTDASGTHDVAYSYDADGNLVTTTRDGTEVRSLVDVNRPFTAVLAEYTPEGTLQASYVYGLAMVSETRGVTVSYAHADGLGSLRAQTDPTGAVTDRYLYDAFGQVVAHAGGGTGRYLFNGELLEPLTGLYDLRARRMDPQTGRFLSRDAVPGSASDPVTLNRYVYAGADPVNKIDPSGNETLGDMATAIAITSVLASLPSVALFIGAAIFGWPDELEIGGGSGAGGHIGSKIEAGVEGVFGFDVAFIPREEEIKLETFGAAEPFVATGAGGHASVSFLKSVANSLKEEAFVFGGWLWAPEHQETPTDSIFDEVLGGVTIGGNFFGGGKTSSGTRVFIYGASASKKSDVFLFAIKDLPVHVSVDHVSKTAMIAAASIGQSAVGALMSRRWGFTNGIGLVASVLINTISTATWIEYTYGKPKN